MKKTIAIVLSLVLMLATFAGCAPATPAAETATEAPATEAATEAPAAAEAPAADGDKVINIYTFTDEAPALAVTAFELDWLPHPLTRITGVDENDEPIVEVLDGHHCNVRVRGDVPASLAECCVDPDQPVRVFAGA